MSENRRLEEALRQTADGMFPLDELHALIHEARPEARQQGGSALRVGREALLRVIDGHAPLDYPGPIHCDCEAWPKKGDPDRHFNDHLATVIAAALAWTILDELE